MTWPFVLISLHASLGALGFVRVSVTVMCVCARMFLGECVQMDARAMARASRCVITRVITPLPFHDLF